MDFWRSTLLYKCTGSKNSIQGKTRYTAINHRTWYSLIYVLNTHFVMDLWRSTLLYKCTGSTLRSVGAKQSQQTLSPGIEHRERATGWTTLFFHGWTTLFFHGWTNATIDLFCLIQYTRIVLLWLVPLLKCRAQMSMLVPSWNTSKHVHEVSFILFKTLIKCSSRRKSPKSLSSTAGGSCECIQVQCIIVAS